MGRQAAGDAEADDAAAASRKRLEGVTSIAIAKQLEESEPKTYNINEDDDDAGSASGSDSSDHSTM